MYAIESIINLNTIDNYDVIAAIHITVKHIAIFIPFGHHKLL